MHTVILQPCEYPIREQDAGGPHAGSAEQAQLWRHYGTSSDYGRSIDCEISITQSFTRNRIIGVRPHAVLLWCCIHLVGPSELRGTVGPSVTILITVCPSLGESRSRAARSSDRLLPGRRNRTVLPDRRPHLNSPPPGAVPTPFLVDFCIRVPSPGCANN